MIFAALPALTLCGVRVPYGPPSCGGIAEAVETGPLDLVGGGVANLAPIHAGFVVRAMADFAWVDPLLVLAGIAIPTFRAYPSPLL